MKGNAKHYLNIYVLLFCKMDIYRKQVMELRPEDVITDIQNFFSVVIIKEFSDDNLDMTLKSLKKQIYQNFEFTIVDWTLSNWSENTWLQAPCDIHELRKKKLEIAITSANGKYIYLVKAGNYCVPHMLASFNFSLKDNMAAIAYSDEAVYYENPDSIIQPEIKGTYSEIKAAKHLYSGQAVLWEKLHLEEVLPKIRSEKIDTILREIFLYIYQETKNILYIPQILLLKSGLERSSSEEQKLLPVLNSSHYMQEKIGYFRSSTSYNQYCFELYNELDLNNVAIILCVENQKRSCALLSQLYNICPEIKILAGCNRDEHYNGVSIYCRENHLTDHVNIYLLEKSSYGKGILYLSQKTDARIQVVIRDAIRWCNKDDMMRMLCCFLYSKVMAVSPQIATATTSTGELPKIVYGGGSVKDVSLSTDLFSGRLQNIYGELDPVWTNRPLDMLSSYCFAVRKDVWQLVKTLHESIKNADQFAMELSFALMANNMLCEFSAQSSFWLDEELGDGKNLKQYQKTDCYWYWLEKYGEILETAALKDKWLYRSWRTHLNVNFQLYIKDLVRYSKHKRILIYTHELSLTGAPIVLAQAVQILRQANYDILVISPCDGPIKKQYLDNGIPVIIDPMLYDSNSWLSLASDFELTLVNTVVPYKSIEAAGQINLPVLWWLHDSRIGYQDWLRYVLPKEIDKNVHIYAVSPYAKRVIQEYRPDYHVDILPYGLEDFIFEHGKNIDFGLPDNKIIFVNIGQIMMRKGQDILSNAIELLDPQILKNSYFLFIGSVVDRHVFSKIQKLCERFPEHVRYIEKIPHEQMKYLYRQIDVVICSSRDDPLPTFITEGLISSRVCICSENTGFYGLIEHGKNGFLYSNNNEEELSSIISYIVDNPEAMENVKKAGRKLYEMTLSEEIFRKNLLTIVHQYMADV